MLAYLFNHIFAMHLLMFMLTLISFSGCKNSEMDVRRIQAEEWVGQWQGKQMVLPDHLPAKVMGNAPLVGILILGTMIYLGMKISADLAIQLEGSLLAEICDVYKIICYPNQGTACCTTQDWFMCASSGCPTVEIVYN